jgi:hypothetical protein
MVDLPNPRRFALDAARRYLLDGIGHPADREDERRGDQGAADDDPPARLTPNAIKRTRVSRSRERILANLDEMYREAFERAKASGDDAQMAALDFAYRREQLYFEILLDIRDATERDR